MPSTLPSNCPVCGMHYRDFRTGVTWREAFDQLFSPSRASSEWVQVSAKTVKGRLWEIKQALWEQHLNSCHPEYSMDVSPVEEY